jgi:hypothetical protein
LRLLKKGYVPGLVVVGEDRDGGLVEVVELAGVDRAPEGGADDDREDDAERHEEEEDVHGYRRRRSAFATTTSELSDIPAAATSGVTHPTTASGIAITL